MIVVSAVTLFRLYRQQKSKDAWSQEILQVALLESISSTNCQIFYSYIPTFPHVLLKSSFTLILISILNVLEIIFL